MSHFTRIKTQIYEAEVLKEVLNELNYEISNSTILLGYRNQKYNVDFQAKLDNYSIGFKKTGKVYDIVGDLYLIPNSRNVINTIKQQYAKKVVIRNLRQIGYRVLPINQTKNKTIQIVMIKR